VKPERSYDELEAMVANAEKVLQLLGSISLVMLCTGIWDSLVPSV